MYTIHQMSKAQVTFMKVGAEDTLPEAIAFARNYHGLKKPDVTVTVELENTAVPVASFSTRRIMGDFTKQIWGGRKGDDAIYFDEERFDATLHILSMPYKDVIRIRDNNDSSDVIGQAHVQWDGPHEVQLVDSMCDFFGVSRLAELSQDHFNFVVECRQAEIQAQQRTVRAENVQEPAAERLPAPADAARDLIISLSQMALPGEVGPDGKAQVLAEGTAQAHLADIIRKSRLILAQAQAQAHAASAPDDEEEPESPRP
ncbi:hypothetical protein [Massilia varians]|jgi:hypothetical protein|uniref:hypothetical protein n=1 Tax=Massilia varians TaxID=457921 RepID=UPI002556DB97|nr:hypothetical protein [Massilia varians]MDK6079784.1 hypothetical protein [Massilia varians]